MFPHLSDFLENSAHRDGSEFVLERVHAESHIRLVVYIVILRIFVVFGLTWEKLGASERGVGRGQAAQFDVYLRNLPVLSLFLRLHSRFVL